MNRDKLFGAALLAPIAVLYAVFLLAPISNFLATSLFTYDAFAFVQGTFLLFITLGIGAAGLRITPGESGTAPEAASARASGDGRPIRLHRLAAGQAYAPEA